jgi:hypothetical protein
MSSFEILLPDSDIRQMRQINEKKCSFSKLYKMVNTTHINCMLISIILIILINIFIKLSPLLDSANKLIHDTNDELVNINEVIPVIQYNLKELHTIMPEIKDMLRIVKRLCSFANFTTNYGFLCE